MLKTVWVFFALLSVTASANTSTERISRITPQQSYFDYRPEWGVELSGSSKEVGEREFFSDPSQKSATNSVYLQVEYQPSFLQAIGIIGVGPSLAAHPTGADQRGLKSNLVFAWSAGAQARYQARFFRNQFIVPMVSYSAEMWSYRFRDGSHGRLTTQGPTFGAWVLLNYLDSKTGQTFFYDYGIARTYLVVEMRILKGSNSNVTLDGRTYYAGLRFEY